MVIALLVDHQGRIIINRIIPLGHLMVYIIKFFTEVLFLSILLCLVSTGIVNVLVSTLYSKPDEVTGYECGLYSTKGGRLTYRCEYHYLRCTVCSWRAVTLTTWAPVLQLLALSCNSTFYSLTFGDPWIIPRRSPPLICSYTSFTSVTTRVSNTIRLVQFKLQLTMAFR